jgi:hypothetical protein
MPAQSNVSRSRCDCFNPGGQRKRSGTQNAIEKEDVIMTRVIMTRIATVENTRDSALLGNRSGLSSFLRCTFSALAGLFICALQLAPLSGAQPIAGDGPRPTSRRGSRQRTRWTGSRR